MSLTSFDDLPFEYLLNPFLTVVKQPAYELGSTAAGSCSIASTILKKPGARRSCCPPRWWSARRRPHPAAHIRILIIVYFACPRICGPHIVQFARLRANLRHAFVPQRHPAAPTRSANRTYVTDKSAASFTMAPETFHILDAARGAHMTYFGFLAYFLAIPIAFLALVAWWDEHPRAQTAVRAVQLVALRRDRRHLRRCPDLYDALGQLPCRHPCLVVPRGVGHRLRDRLGAHRGIHLLYPPAHPDRPLVSRFLRRTGVR